MKIEDIPSVKSVNYPESVSVKLSTDAFSYIQELKARKKDASALMRMLLDKFMAENPLDKSA